MMKEEEARLRVSREVVECEKGHKEAKGQKGKLQLGTFQGSQASRGDEKEKRGDMGPVEEQLGSVDEVDSQLTEDREREESIEGCLFCIAPPTQSACDQQQSPAHRQTETQRSCASG